MLFIGFGKPEKRKKRIVFTAEKAKKLGSGGVPRRKVTLLFQQYKIDVRKHKAAAKQIEHLFKQFEKANETERKSINQRFAQIFQKVLDWEAKK